MNRLQMLTVAACLAIALSPVARPEDSIPNASFEQWTLGEPDGWLTTNNGPYITITQTADAQAGSLAAHGEVVEVVPGVNLRPFFMVRSPGSDAGMPISQRWATVHGYYKLNPVGGDKFIVTVTFTAASSPIATGIFVDSNTVSTYQEFVVDMGYFTSDTPDSAFIFMEVLGPGIDDYHLGTEIFVDNLSLSGVATSVDSRPDLTPTAFELQNYPNPFNPSTTISYFIPQSAKVNLQIFNVLGQSVRTLVNEEQAAGSHSVIWNGADHRGVLLPSGLYFYRLQEHDRSLVNRMLMLK